MNWNWNWNWNWNDKSLAQGSYLQTGDFCQKNLKEMEKLVDLSRSRQKMIELLCALEKCRHLPRNESDLADFPKQNEMTDLTDRK